MNKVILLGRLCKDPEIIRKNENVVCKFTLAVNRKYVPEGGQQADFIQCVAFKKTAEFIKKYFYKGSRICIEGAWRSGSYTKNTGETVFTNDCMVESVEFADAKKEGQTTGDAIVDGNLFDGVDDEDDLPF